MDERTRSRIEDSRQIEHLLPVGFAFLLPYLPYGLILALALLAVVHALYFSPKFLRVTTRQEERARAYSPGKLIYALVVLALLVVFRERIYIAASVWGILAVGDSTSNLIGRRVGHFRLPHNPKKTWAGFASFCILGGLAGWILLLWNFPEPQTYRPGTLFFFAALTALFCALVESLPTVLDDNLTVAWTGATSYFLLFSVQSAVPVWTGSLAAAVAINLLAAVPALRFGWLSPRGTAAAFIVGTIVWVSLGLAGFAVLASFLVVGSVTTGIGFQRKRALRVSQGSTGERGVSNILANGAVPLVLAVLHPWLPLPGLRLAYTAAIATAAFDTISTEIGQLLGRHPVHPLTFRRAVVGTKGAISIEGTAAGLVGAFLVVLVGWVAGLISPGQSAFAVLGAFLGTMFESLLASTFRYDFDHSDEALNLYSTMFGATMAAALWTLLA